MSKRIRVLKGTFNKIKITDCTFNLLQSINTTNGITTAKVDGSSLFGEAFKNIIIQVEDYKVIN